MTYLPITQSLLIAGGRNDQECKRLNTPFLSDIQLFLLDQRAWINIKYFDFSTNLSRLGYHTMVTMSDGDTYEKTFIFGGITYSKTESI